MIKKTLIIFLFLIIASLNALAIEDAGDLQQVIDRSECLKNLPEEGRIKLYLTDGKYYLPDNVFFISQGNKVNKFSNQEFELEVFLDLKHLGELEKSDNIDLEFKKIADNKDLKVYYKKFFDLVKYRPVKSCINKAKAEPIKQSPEPQKQTKQQPSGLKENSSNNKNILNSFFEFFINLFKK